MSNNKLLKFPSQRQLVDRLLHLIEFNHPYIFLSGKPGSGRGTLCESLLAQLPDTVRVVSLIGSPAMKMADVRQLLLQQVVARPLFNAQDALADSFFRMLEGKPSTLLLMIERADTLLPAGIEVDEFDLGQETVETATVAVIEFIGQRSVQMRVQFIGAAGTADADAPHARLPALYRR